jgi:hypothetical protein
VAVVDQIRAVAKHRLKKKIESLSLEELDEICQAVATILEISTTRAFSRPQKAAVRHEV